MKNKMTAMEAKVAAQAKEREFKEVISGTALEYLRDQKGFSEDFLKVLPKKVWAARVIPMFKQKDKCIEIMERMGFEHVKKDYIDAMYAYKDGQHMSYFFGKIPEEYPERTVSDLVEYVNDPELTAEWRKYLGMFWLKPDTYYGRVSKNEAWNNMTEIEQLEKLETAKRTRNKVEGFAFEYLPMYKSEDMMEELRRFNLSVSQVNADLISFEMIQDENAKDVEKEDTSRGIDYVKRVKTMAEINADPEVRKMYKITQTVNKMLCCINPALDIGELRGQDDNPVIYTLDEMNEKVASCAGVEYTNGHGQLKKCNDWNRIIWFKKYYDEGLIDRDELKYIASVTEKSLASYEAKLAENGQQ